MKYLVAILLPENIAKKVKTVQQKYKNGRWNISLPPHITLVSPAKAKKSISEARDIIQKSINNIECLKIEFDKTDHFLNQGHTIYKGVKITPELLKLAQVLNYRAKEFCEVKKYKKFVPHITLSNNLNQDEFLDRFPKIKKEKIANSFMCDRVALLTRKPDQKQWQIESSFVFSGN